MRIAENRHGILRAVKSFDDFLNNNEHQFNQDLQQQATEYRQALVEIWENYTRNAQQIFKNSS